MLPVAGPGAGVASPSLSSETLVVGLDLMIRSNSRRAGGDAREMGTKRDPICICLSWRLSNNNLQNIITDASVSQSLKISLEAKPELNSWRKGNSGKSNSCLLSLSHG